MSYFNVSDGSSPITPDIETLTGNSGGAVGPDGAFNINLLGADGINVVGNPATNTLTFSLTGGSAAIDSIGVDGTSGTGTNPVLPTALGLISTNGAVVAASTTPVRTISTAPNVYQVQIQTSQAIASTDATKIGLCNFDSSHFSVDANGFVTLSGGGQAIDSFITNVAGPVDPNGSGQILVNASATTFTDGTVANTLKTEVQSAAHTILIGAGPNTASTPLAPSATLGVPIISNGAAADPSYGTALIAGGGTAATSFNINGAVYSGTTTTSALQAATLTSGQLLIGGTTTPAAATLTAGTGISILNGNNSITISASGSGLAWSDQSGAFNAVASNGYFITNTSTSTLPASPSEGDYIAYIVDTTNILTIQANTGQTIRIGTTLSTTAGTCANTARGDSIELIYRATGAVWCSLAAPQGGWNIST